MVMACDIYEFLESKEKTLLLQVCPDKLFNELESLKVEVNHDSMETNGWQWDYWVDAKYKKINLRLSGSGYYGNAKIEKL